MSPVLILLTGLIKVLSTGIAVATNYAAATTGVGDLAFQPSMDQVIFALKVCFCHYKAVNRKSKAMSR